MKKLLLSLLASLGIFFSSVAQEADLKDLFLAAESFYLFEEFSEALPLYLRIHRQMPENNNVNYKIGVCYLNDPYQKDKSITYLETASKDINTKYKENNFKETSAPLEVLFYLGNAYRINNQLTKAKEYYQEFKSRMDPEIYDMQLVDEQVIACENAGKLMKKPIDFDAENLGSIINTRFTDQNPVISGDETKLAFVSRLQFYDAVFYSEKIDGKWTTPRNIIPELGVDGDVYPTALSYNGTEMIIYRSDEFIGNLYSSSLVNGKWTPLKKLNDNINTRFWESHGSLSKDGKTLYFASNRKDGFGGLDIYYSKRQEDGDWGIPVNLGPTINTKYNDDTPFITESGEKLFFSSYGHFNIGGYDIFMSRKNADGTWANPVNIGYPINTTDDDQFLVPLKDGQVAYYSRFDEKNGYGRNDILRYRIYTADHPRLYKVEGNILLPPGSSTSDKLKISVIEIASKDTLALTNSDASGDFQFEVPEGKYDMIFDGEKFRQKIVPLEISSSTPHEGIVLQNPVALELLPPPMPLEEAEKLLTIREDSIIYARPGEEVKIRYTADKGSEVIIDVYNEGKLISSDSLIADKRRQSFDFIPLPGKNEVQITVTDKDGNTITRKITVITPKEVSDYDQEAELLKSDESAKLDEDKKLTPIEESTDINEIIQSIHEFASPELKNYLNNLDPEAAGIKSQKDLINHLFNAGAKGELSTRELIEALASAGLIDELDILIHELAGVSSPGLQKYLLGLDPSAENISTESELIQHLYDHAGPDTYSIQDINNALSRLSNLKEIRQLIEELKDHTDGALYEYLSTLDPAEDSIYSMGDLQQHLFNNAEENGFTKEDVIRMFESYFDSQKGSMKKVLERMMNNSEGEIFDYLGSINNSWNETLEDRKSFYDILYEGAAKKKIGQEELIKLALDAEDIILQNLKDHIDKYGSNKLQEALYNLPEGINAPEKLFEFLLSDQSIEKSEINGLAKDYLYSKELYDRYYSLLRNSDGALKEYLESLDIKNSGFKTPGELIDHLLGISKEKGFTKEDVYKALSISNNESFINQVISDLMKLAPANIKYALMDLDPVREKIHSLEDIIDYLLKNKDKYGFNEKDVYDLIKEYLSGEWDEIEFIEDGSGLSEETRTGFSRGVKLTAGILIAEGFIILILIILAKRKRKKELKQSRP